MTGFTEESLRTILALVNNEHVGSINEKDAYYYLRVCKGALWKDGRRRYSLETKDGAAITLPYNTAQYMRGFLEAMLYLYRQHSKH